MDERFAVGPVLPALFVGHGNPMNAIEDNAFSRAWSSLGLVLPRPAAILCISAHWQTRGTRVTSAERPPTLHDFSGFPRALYDVVYPAPGSPELARLVQQTVRSTAVEPDAQWGLDHGAWSVLCRLFPAADIPVVQLSMDRTRPPAFHYELGRELRTLRSRGVLIVGSGNIVHNLRAVRWEDTAYDWAVSFDAQVRQRIVAGDHAALVDYRNLGEGVELAVPTLEHYLPLLYILGLQDEQDAVSFFAEQVTLGSMSMRSVLIGGEG